MISELPQGSVLAPFMFGINVNDMDEGVNNYMSFFADDAKLLKKISNKKDCEAFQDDFQKIWTWGQKWEMDFNIKKM